ncbi:MAG TPA: DUF6292 family protein [Amycolatopsis sp.]|nr:DUF6292 family protein [Amycolatopsis sp.]
MSLISKPEFPSTAERDLAAYFGAVARALGLPEADTGCEVTDVTCGHVFLSGLADDHPARDLLLIWDEGRGWQLARESDAGTLHVVATLPDGPRPTPVAVAAFVARTRPGRRDPFRAARRG